jgi:O-antigen/teichoic acid export membrane protein
MIESFLQNTVSKYLNVSGFKKYFFNTSWMLSEQIVRLVANFFVGIYVARYLGPLTFGTYSFIIGFVAIFQGLAKLGSDEIIVRELVKSPQNTNPILGTAFRIKLYSGIVSIIFLFIAILFTSVEHYVMLYVIIVSAGIIFQSFEVVDFYFQANVLSKYVSISRIIQLAISSILKLYFILINADLFWFVIVFLVDQVTLGLTLLFIYKQQTKAAFIRYYDTAIAKQLFVYAWPLFLSSIAVIIYMRIDLIMINEMLGARLLGIYSSASRISEIWYFIPIVIANSIFPAMIQSKIGGKKKYYVRLQILYTVLIWTAILIAIPVTLFGKLIIVGLYGKVYAEAGIILSINIWAGVFVFAGVASAKWYLAENFQKILIVNTIAGAFCKILLNFFLIPKYGLIGASIATISSQALSAYFMNIVHKKTRNNFFCISRSIFKPWTLLEHRAA